MMAMIGEGIFTQDGPAWKKSRDLLRRQFMRMQYQNLEGFREHVENLIANLRNVSGVTDLQPFFYRLTLNTTIAMILGQPVESFEHDIGDLFSKSFDKASLVTAIRVRLGTCIGSTLQEVFLQPVKQSKDTLMNLLKTRCSERRKVQHCQINLHSSLL